MFGSRASKLPSIWPMTNRELVNTSRCSTCRQPGATGRLGLCARALCKLWYVGDDCLEHSRYGLDLVSKHLNDLGVTAWAPRLSGGRVSLGSLNRCEYHPGMQEDGFSFPNKGNGGGGCGAPSEVICVVGGHLPRRNQHDMVRPARARAAPV
ncbi:hypothetical protein BHM03_00032597 [Ensete ventricosum]|nr:hypothetical protein BHM03_00032597 [Ensete ventricosum]